MQTGIDSQDENQGPILNNKIWISIYFIVFVVIFSFFFINVFVGLIILTFQNLNTDSTAELDRNTVSFVDYYIVVLIYNLCSKNIAAYYKLIVLSGKNRRRSTDTVL